MSKRLLLTIILSLTVSVGVWSQSAITDIPKQVNAKDAHIRDIGMAACDVFKWAVEDSITHQVDTVFTVDSYILWQSNGDIDEQAQDRRKRGIKAASSRTKAVSEFGRTASLVDGWLAEYHYYVFIYDYPSVDADGKPVTLSSIGACPRFDETSHVQDVVIGTHITITANRECPTNTTDGFAETDWGLLFSLAGGPKITLGENTNIVMGIVTFFTGWIGAAIWAGVGIATEVAQSEPSNNYNLVIMPDYEGYGLTVNRSHPYLYQELTARQVVDATRYGIALYKDLYPNGSRAPLREDFRTISCGYSQGGSVALATHRFIEQNNLTDELHFAGSICGDGPYDPMSTLMYYVEQDLKGKAMSMPVVLPLIVKGMLDSNPYMRGHKAEDYFQQEFLDTGIMDWLTQKQKSTDDIENAWAAQASSGEWTIFEPNGKIKMRNIMNQQCYQYFVDLYNANKDTYTQKAGIPLPSHRGIMEDLHLALASNDMTKGWTPAHAILLFHSTDDTVVPYVNATKAKNSLGNWAVLHPSSLGHDHVASGTDFFKSDNNWQLVKKLDLRLFIAKKKVCDLPWSGQTTSSIPQSW